MKKFSRIILLSAVVGVMALTGLVMQSGNSGATQPINKQTEALDVPVLTLKDWQDSSKSEKMSFLYGFVTMIGLEREWQGHQALPIRQSINSTWAKGLEGLTISEICKAVDAYAVEHPDQSDRAVLSVMGQLYVRPKMNDADRKAAAKRWEEVKKGR